MSEIQALREQMCVTERYAYFDHAAVAPLPSPSSEAIALYAREAAEMGDADWPKWGRKVSDLRECAANLLDVTTNEIALVNSTTQGINLVAEGMPWNNGDNVLIPENEFPSNMVAWQNLKRRGVEVRRVPVAHNGAITAATFRPFLDDRTRVISLSWVGYSTGYRADVGSIVELAHAHHGKNGPVLVCLDAIQGLGAFPLNVRDLDLDFVCADGHKWMLGPEGAGLFYIKSKHLDLLQPLGLGWNSLAASGFQPFRGGELKGALKQNASRYEGGATNISGMHGLGASLELLLDIGVNSEPSTTQRCILDNVASLERKLSKVKLKAHLPVEEEHRSGIVGITWPEAEQDETLLIKARNFLLENRIVTSVRGGRLRISTHAYNNEEELERLVQTLVEFRS
ncbi:MAG: aminotransferase class V-fold PLP-dependent enzyme [Planctomycetota bacterium]